MNNKQKKVVGISFWFLLYRLLYRLAFFVLLLIMCAIAFTVILPKSPYVAHLSIALSIIAVAVFFLGDLLYWKFSGIYINDGGDHIVKIAGLVSKEHTLLNGVIVANRVIRGPIDQLLGMATLSAGLFEGKSLRGVKYKDIERYNSLMRDGSGGHNASFF